MNYMIKKLFKFFLCFLLIFNLFSCRTNISNENVSQDLKQDNVISTNKSNKWVGCWLWGNPESYNPDDEYDRDHYTGKPIYIIFKDYTCVRVWNKDFYNSVHYIKESQTQYTKIKDLETYDEFTFGTDAASATKGTWREVDDDIEMEFPLYDNTYTESFNEVIEYNNLKKNSYFSDYFDFN